MTPRLKHTIIRVFFVSEIILFSIIYCFGPQGVSLMVQLQRDNRVLCAQLDTLHAESAALESDISAWKAHPFYKEKVAREKLQMARVDDTIFYLQ